MCVDLVFDSTACLVCMWVALLAFQPVVDQAWAAIIHGGPPLPFLPRIDYAIYPRSKATVCLLALIHCYLEHPNRYVHERLSPFSSDPSHVGLFPLLPALLNPRADTVKTAAPTAATTYKPAATTSTDSNTTIDGDVGGSGGGNSSSSGSIVTVAAAAGAGGALLLIVAVVLLVRRYRRQSKHAAVGNIPDKVVSPFTGNAVFTMHTNELAGVRASQLEAEPANGFSRTPNARQSTGSTHMLLVWLNTVCCRRDRPKAAAGNPSPQRHSIVH